jgi:hypothetical protein
MDLVAERACVEDDGVCNFQDKRAPACCLAINAERSPGARGERYAAKPRPSRVLIESAVPRTNRAMLPPGVGSKPPDGPKAVSTCVYRKPHPS